MRRLPIVLSVLISLITYLPSLSYDRTLDDLVQVPTPGQKTNESWSAAWTRPYWHGEYAGGGLYRPVTSSTFWLESRLGCPLRARHLFNVALYAGVVGLLVALGLRLGLTPVAGLVAGIVFAWHPTHVEAVAGLVGRAELLAAVWILIALHLHDHLLQNRRRGSPFTSLLGFTVLAFLAAGSKESAWTLALYALPLHARYERSARKGWPAWAGYGFGLLFHLLVRRHVLGGWVNTPGVVISPDENPLVALSGLERLLAGFRVAGVFLGHLVFPVHLSPDYSGRTIRLSVSLIDPAFLAGCTFVVAAPLLLLLGWRQRERAWGAACLAAAIWIGTAFLLTMNVFMNLATVLADRLLFWPSAGWSLFVSATAFEVGRRVRARRPPFIPVAALALLASGYAFITFSYLPVWRNNLVLFERARHIAPTSARVWSAYGRALTDVGRTQEALDALHRSEQLSPGFQSAWLQESALLIGAGRMEEAKAPLRQALRISPKDVSSRMNEGIIWLFEGKTKDALTRFREILAEVPGHLLARRYLAMALEVQGTSAEAAQAWRSYLELAPSDAKAIDALARICLNEPNGAAEAETLARRALTLDPKVSDFQDALAEALFREGKFEAAAAAWRAYLEAVPNNPTVMNDLAWILATKLGRVAEAEPLARNAVRLDPKNPVFMDTLAECLARQGKHQEAAEIARQGLALEGAPPDLRRFTGHN